jgi:adenylosuccinate synthase
LTTTIVNGGQWGDEGKGKIVGFLAEHYDVGIRSTAGDNAGHTVLHNGRTFKFRLLPSTMALGKPSIVADDVLINPATLVGEIQELRQAGLPVDDMLRISRNAHIVLPYHAHLDECVERGEDSLGTTQKGVGPAIADKVNRIGIRMEDFIVPDRFRRLLKRNLREKTRLLGALFHESADGLAKLNADKILGEYARFARLLSPLTTDTVGLVHSFVRRGQNLLIEGAQGTMNDLTYGTYPFVTASRPIAAGVVAGTGLGPTAVDQVISVIKPYQTRVGKGPIPAEILDGTAEDIRVAGNEYGTVTKRPRRIMWFDLVVAKYARDLNGTTHFALTKLDVLDSLSEIRVCTSYTRQGLSQTGFPSQVDIGEVTEQYRVFPGWRESTSKAETYTDLPKRARVLVDYLANELETPIALISVGPEVERTIVVDGSALPSK